MFLRVKEGSSTKLLFVLVYLTNNKPLFVISTAAGLGILCVIGLQVDFIGGRKADLSTLETLWVKLVRWFAGLFAWFGAQKQ